MAETHKTWTAIQAALADNSAKVCTPRDVRDALYSLSQIWGGLSVTGGTTTTALNTGSYTTLDLADFTNHASSVGVSPDKANDRITLPGVAGLYMVLAALSYQCSSFGNTLGFKFQLDGSDIVGGAYNSIRAPASNVPYQLAFAFPVHYTSGNGYLTLLAIASSGTPTVRLNEGGIWVYRAV